jgi:hypothetical protein
MAKTEIKLVAFVDILGFSQLILDYDAGKNDEIFELLKQAVDPAATFLKQNFKPFKNSPFYDWKDCLDVRLFSDCLCVAAPLEYKQYGFIDQLAFFYKYLTGYQSLLMSHGFFTRGAVTIGSHYASENMIFSGGLVEAYQLESKKARYPRIIISERLLGEIDKFAEGRQAALNHMLVRDSDYVFFNHFNYTLIDADGQDGDIDTFLKKIGFEGMSDKTFRQLDEENKNKEMAHIMHRAIQEIEKNLGERVSEKYEWMVKFIDYELGKNDTFSPYHAV